MGYMQDADAHAGRARAGGSEFSAEMAGERRFLWGSKRVNDDEVPDPLTGLEVFAE